MNTLLELNYNAGSVADQEHFLISEAPKENGFVFLSWAKKSNNKVTVEEHDVDDRIRGMIDTIWSRQLGK